MTAVAKADAYPEPYHAGQNEVPEVVQTVAQPVVRAEGQPKLTNVTIICNQAKFEDLKSAMNGIGVTGMTVTQVLGCGIQKGKTEYYRIGKSFEPNRQRVNLYQLVLTKDYIVALQRDYQRDPVDESQIGQQQGKLPKQLFVYDYEGRLLQILDLKMPTLRIAATPDRNEVYALVANPEYGLAKVEL